MSLSILTWNIHKGFSSNNREFVLHRIRDQLRETGVDVALLQEVQGEHQWHSQRIRNWPDTSQFEFLADEVWQHHAYGKNAIADGRHHGNAILSKYPFAEWGNINISPFRTASRSLLHGNITIPERGKKVHVVSLHLGLLGIERRSQLFVNRSQRLLFPEPESLLTLQILFILVPGVLLVLAGWVLKNYPLTAARHNEIRQALDARDAEARA